jgi:pimeloyl-ACP methyl ester carboxylesterase
VRVTLFLLVVIPAAHADTVVLKSGKKLENVVVSVNDDDRVVINPWNSRHPEMTWGIGKEHTFSRDQVKEVIIADPPRVEYLRLAGKRPLDATAHFDIATFCGEHGLKDERLHHLERCLALDPEHAEALAAYGDGKWKTQQLKVPTLAPAVLEAARAYLAAEDAAAAEEAWSGCVRAGEKRPHFWLERARRSQQVPRGRRDKVKLSYESEKTPGATYCVVVPKSYDPLVPTPLVVALHGGGRGGKDDTVVSGSGEDAMPFYQDLAETWGWIVVAPSAVVAEWGQPQNDQYVQSLLGEMKALFNVDLTRVYVTGHSMGGFGAWYFAIKRPELWTAASPCAGGTNPSRAASVELPLYVYHGTDDEIVRVDNDREAVKLLRGDDDGKKKPKVERDFVYTELNGVGHGFPDWVRRDIFAWFAGRAINIPDRKKKFVGPISSFDAKPSKLEIDAFGDPSKPSDGDGASDSVKALLSELAKGGGGGEQALATLREKAAAKPDEKLARQLVPLLNAEKHSADTRVLAARAIGAHHAPFAIKLLTPAIDDPDFRVVEAVIDGLAEIGGKEAIAPLTACSKRLRELFEGSIRNGNRIDHTEYEVRLESFGNLLAAFAAVKDAASFVPAIERDLVKPIYLAEPRYDIPGDTDPRFKDDSKNARRKLGSRLRECLVALGDPNGATFLHAIAEAWSTETKLVEECEQGAAELEP